MYRSDKDPIQAKEEFARALLHMPHQPMSAAQTVFPHDTQSILWAMNNWVHDPYVLQVQKRLLDEEGAEAFLPSREELAHRIFHDALVTRDGDVKVKGFKLFAEVMGMIDRGTKVNVNTNIDQSTKVLVVHRSTPEQVEARQASLLLEMAKDVL